MTAQLTLTKDTKNQHIIFDELFLEASTIEVLAFNYDAEGTALCRCDGEVKKIDKQRLERIILGVNKLHLDELLTSIFDSDLSLNDSPRHGEQLAFRLPALREISKYEAGNLAKAKRKEIRELKFETFHYFTIQQDKTATAALKNTKTKPAEKKPPAKARPAADKSKTKKK